MIKLGHFNFGDKIVIVDDENKTHSGVVECITGVEERSDLEKQEDGIGIITDDGRHIEFYISDIKSISHIATTYKEAI